MNNTQEQSLKYVVWACSPNVMPKGEYDGWRKVCTTNDLNTLFIEQVEARLNYQEVEVCQKTELKVEVADD